VLWSLSALLPVELFGSPGNLAAIATAVVAVLLAGVLLRQRRDRTPARVPVRAMTPRERARYADAIRQCDPDAAGRPRPRAPSTRPPAA
jgi:hypothetical protein